MGFSATDAAALRPYADNVMIAGVKSKPELNGKLGMIVGPFDLQSGRISVLVEGTPAAISLKPENLEETGMSEGSFYHIHPSGPSTMPQQDQKPTAKAKPSGTCYRMTCCESCDGLRKDETCANCGENAIPANTWW